MVSAARRPEKQEKAFQTFMLSFDAEQAFLSSVSIMEVRFGIQRERDRDAAFAAELSRWLDEVMLVEFAGRILSFDLSTALRAGALATAGRRPTADAMIAATALEHDLQVVTRTSRISRRWACLASIPGATFPPDRATPGSPA